MLMQHLYSRGSRIEDMYAKSRELSPNDAICRTQVRDNWYGRGMTLIKSIRVRPRSVGNLALACRCSGEEADTGIKKTRGRAEVRVGCID